MLTDQAYQRGYEAGFNDGQSSSLDADLLKRLLHLCHPDKHDGSLMANRAFQDLQRYSRKTQ